MMPQLDDIRRIQTHLCTLSAALEAEREPASVMTMAVIALEEDFGTVRGAVESGDGERAAERLQNSRAPCAGRRRYFIHHRRYADGTSALRACFFLIDHVSHEATLALLLIVIVVQLRSPTPLFVAVGCAEIPLVLLPFQGLGLTARNLTLTHAAANRPLFGEIARL